MVDDGRTDLRLTIAVGAGFLQDGGDAFKQSRYVRRVAPPNFRFKGLLLFLELSLTSTEKDGTHCLCSLS